MARNGFIFLGVLQLVVLVAAQDNGTISGRYAYTYSVVKTYAAPSYAAPSYSVPSYAAPSYAVPTNVVPGATMHVPASASAVIHCPFAGCTDHRTQSVFPANIRGSTGIARPPCYCTPQECPQCPPGRIRPARVLSGNYHSFAEPDELAWGCNRHAECIQTPPCTPCYPDQPTYDVCICYGPGICMCWVASGHLIDQWPQPRQPCYCEPQICQGCPPMGVEPFEDVIGRSISMAEAQAVSVSHACDWSLPCIPTPICHACLQVLNDHCICYGPGTCVCFTNHRKGPCYCAQQVCPRCFLDSGYPAVVSPRSHHQGAGMDKDVIATGCNSASTCVRQPACRACRPTDLKYETCVYYAPGLSTCYVGRSSAVGGIFG